MEFISHHIMPLVIISLGGGHKTHRHMHTHTRAHAHTHAHTHTHTHTHVMDKINL